MAKVQNTLIVIGDTTISANIKPTSIEALKQCAEATGWSLSRLLNRAIDNFRHDEVPVFMEAAERQQHQRV